LSGPVTVYAILLVSVAMLAWVIRTVNQFARLENLIRESWSDVDVALKRRHDLIPNLVESVKGYVDFEEQILDKILAAREKAAQGGVEEENELSRSLNAFIIHVEAYPEFKASERFHELERELVNSEDKIAAARRFYNSNVRTYNMLLQSFPASLVSGDRTRKEFYEMEALMGPAKALEKK
jgi:LemA protein